MSGEHPLSALRRITGNSQETLLDEIQSLREELQATRDEFKELRKTIGERERKGLMLTDAYRAVLSDFTKLFELVQQENTKREESVRFLLSSVEARITQLVRPDSATASNADRNQDRGLFARRRR